MYHHLSETKSFLFTQTSCIKCLGEPWGGLGIENYFLLETKMEHESLIPEMFALFSQV